MALDLKNVKKTTNRFMQTYVYYIISFQNNNVPIKKNPNRRIFLTEQMYRKICQLDPFSNILYGGGIKKKMLLLKRMIFVVNRSK